jgi:hypothetical protein
MQQIIDITDTSGIRRPGENPAGRVCIVRGCGTHLSTYNPTDMCGAHEGWVQTAPTAQVKADLADLLAEMDRCS